MEESGVEKPSFGEYLAAQGLLGDDEDDDDDEDDEDEADDEDEDDEQDVPALTDNADAPVR
jgi:hypothetical protein